MPQDQFSYCKFTISAMLMSTMCSTLFILNMTFERFYSIIRPHKAASFNTMKRAKITVVVCIIVSMLYNIPHIFLSSSVSRQCVPYGKALNVVYGEFYYWLSIVVNYLLPFVLLLSMNSVIIHTLHKRSSKLTKSSDFKRGKTKNQSSRIQGTDRQIYIILLLVTFGFLILASPAYIFFFYQMFYDYDKSANAFAGFYLYNSVSQKAIYTNNGINFFFYVMAGQKFRKDLKKLFHSCKIKNNLDSGSSLSVVSMVPSTT